MNKLVNHNTKVACKKHLEEAVNAGIVRAPSAPLGVPVLTTTNYPTTLLEKIMGDEPLFVCDRRTKWSWMEKILSAKEQCARFKADGHKFFIYVDSDDGFLWQAPTEEICETIVGTNHIFFQKSNYGYPRYRWFNRKMQKLLGHNGPCAGLYIARTDRFEEYCDIIIRLNALRASLVRCMKYGKNIFDDQASWKTLTAVCNQRLKVDTDYRYLTRTVEPDYNEIL